MNFTAYDIATGEILYSGTADDLSALGSETVGIMAGEAFGRGWIAAGVHHALPVQPSPHHEWDWPSKTWQPNLTAAKEARKTEIDAERERRNQLPIEYAGASFDADAKGQRNVSAWQTQLAASATLPPGFVWRDAINTDHAADAAFVNGLGTAITLRGTQLYAAAWAHKAAVDSLNTVEAVLAHDITQNWI